MTAHQYFRVFSLLCLLLSGFFASGQAFNDYSSSSGFNATGRNNGIAIGDYNNDGFEDIYVSRKDGPNMLYKNNRDFTFSEVGSTLGVNDGVATNTALWLDIDNDGDRDLFLGNYQAPCKLFLNDDGHFTDVTTQYGLNSTGRVISVNATDFDLDGDLDIYIAQFKEKNILWRNEGQYFINVAQASGLFAANPSMAAVFFDMDNDGDPDLYQVNDGNIPNEMYRNEGGFFTDVSSSSNLNFAGFGMGVDVADFNNDGWLDLYITNLYENVLYRNNGNGHFSDLSAISNTDDLGMGWGTLAFDCNNDGRKDIYLANDTYFGVQGQTFPNKLFVNAGGFVFNEESSPEINSPYAAYGAAFADFDRDGQMDLGVINSGSDGNQLFRNTGQPQNFVAFKFTGTLSNTDAIGTRVNLFTPAGLQSDYTTSGSGYASQSSAMVHFGLGDTQSIDSVLVYWPSGEIQKILNPEINVFHNVQEDTGIEPTGLVVWTDPPFPTQFDDVTVYYDASEGNMALLDFEGDVYAHTGVITSESANGNDWKHVIGNWGTADSRTLMTSEGNNIYSISYNIETYYNLNPGEEVFQLAFVFRNVNGSIVGRAADGSDIFTDIYPPDEGLLVTIENPVNDASVLFSDDSLLISLRVNRKAFVEIDDNETSIYADSTDYASFYIVQPSTGTHNLSFRISLDEDTVSLSKNYIVLDVNQTQVNPPQGTRDGLNYYTDSTFVFQLFAPSKDFVFFLCPANNYTLDEAYLMNKGEDQSTFWIELPGSLFEGGQNTYQYLVDGTIAVADPYAEVVLDPWNDQWIDAGILSELPDYPDGLASGIVTAFDLETDDYSWQVNDFVRPGNEDLVIYEMLLRDFLDDHNYNSLIDTLDYFQRLGVNAIELMPVFEFEGNISWGYNPSFHGAIDKYYGSRQQLKRFIDEAHARGIAVILDVVFNHCFSQSPLAQMYWDATNFRPAPDNPWLNVTPRHPFNVGYDFNHMSQATKSWVKRILERWILDYRFDGFRFDLSKGMTQFNSGNDAGLMAQYDAGRITILKDYADYIWSLSPDAYVILEHFAQNSEEKELAEYGMMLWGNMNHEFNEAAMGYVSDLEWADYTVRGWNKPHVIAYMESHDEERLMVRTLQYGDGNTDYNTRRLATALKRMEAVSAIFYTIPGPKMLWQFGEMGYDFSINRCENGTISNDCRLSPKPIRWDYLDDYERARLFDITSNLIHLKTNYPTFSTDDFVFNDGNFYLKTVHLNHPDMDAIAMANFRITNSDINPKFPYPGTWYEYFTGDSLVVVNTQDKLTHAPGEYRLYTSKRLTPPNGFLSSTNEAVREAASVFPNPAVSGMTVKVIDGRLGIVKGVYLLNTQGRHASVTYRQVGETLSLVIPESCPEGVYFIKIQNDNGDLFSSRIAVSQR